MMTLENDIKDAIAKVKLEIDKESDNDEVEPEASFS